MDSLLHRLGFFAVGILIIADLLLLPALAHALKGAGNPASASPANFDVLSADISLSPNAVTQALGGIASSVNNGLNTTATTIGNAGHATVSGIANVGAISATAGKTAASGLYKGSLNTVGAAVTGYFFVNNLPEHALAYTVRSAAPTAIIRPAKHTTFPVISPVATQLVATAVAPAQQAVLAASTSASNSTPIWPIHGAITTLFGVPEPPYQPIHTGLDISDGKPSGTTPIHPFKPGKVINVIHSRIQLGNEVIVDHGDGMTSVYGHMSSTTVEVGQIVDSSSVLGYEGTTGVSTGVHLHFEIRINGTPVNPLHYIDGRP